MGEGGGGGGGEKEKGREREGGGGSWKKYYVHVCGAHGQVDGTQRQWTPG